MRRARILISLFFLQVFPALETSPAADPFAEMVRKTEPLSPEQEREGFHLPENFEITLVASEPALAKPMNMAFDLRGRLWVTDSREYPYSAPADRPGRDSIKILEDTDGDGKADKIITFAEGLNIPIGIYPYGRGAIAFSIPYIYYFQDLDGDGRADRKEVLYGPLGFEKDTHGMTSGFRRGVDGWLYACHGFNNTTTLRAKDGSAITMNSGNTYRMKVDGSRVEQFTFGQVNPFGLAFDPLGNLYSADCHTLPVYQLLRGAYYPSFGKPHDGLGFGPPMMSHLHGSTAIGGIAFYAADQFPAEFRNNIFVGNVMTSRINRDVLEDIGSTRLAREKPDFLKCDDPWFRPVDLQIGPDGSLYVADFYNRIIGHYEVPLDHPGRDRERGRIWRIRYRPADRTPKPPVDWTAATGGHLMEALKEANHPLQLQLLNLLADEPGRGENTELKSLWRRSRNENVRAYGLWVLERREHLDSKILSEAVNDSAALVRTHSLRILGERKTISKKERGFLQAGLGDSNAFVQRAAADALGLHPALEHIEPLLKLLRQTPPQDTHLKHTARIALRNQLLLPRGFEPLSSLKNSEDLKTASEVALGVTNSTSAAFLLQQIKSGPSGSRNVDFLRHVARYGAPENFDALTEVARSSFSTDLELQLSLITAVKQGIGERGGELPASLTNWAVEVATQLFQQSEKGMQDWTHLPLETVADRKAPWILQKRNSADGESGSLLISSLPPGGEHLTGILRSKQFQLPSKFEFFLAGHDGPPGQPAMGKNLVRLKSVETGETLLHVAPPRNDVAQKVEWDLARFAGKQGYLEVVDGNTGEAYAWLAIGRFQPPVVDLPRVAHRDLARWLQSAAELAGTFVAANLVQPLKQLLLNSQAEPVARAAAAVALANYGPLDTNLFGSLLSSPDQPFELQEKIADALAVGGASTAPLLLGALRDSPRRLQIRIADAMASRPPTAEILLTSIEQGKTTSRILLDRRVKEKLAASRIRQAGPRLEKLTQTLPQMDEGRQRLVDGTISTFKTRPGQAGAGEKIFANHCAACHQIGGVGAVVGPQLDGIGNRGLERIVEDIVDPNRNVDEAFKYVTLSLKDGSVLSVLPRREEGDLLVVADSTGKERSVSKKEIELRQASDLSLMPDNFTEIIPSESFQDLLAYLLAQKTAR